MASIFVRVLGQVQGILMSIIGIIYVCGALLLRIREVDCKYTDTGLSVYYGTLTKLVQPS